MPTPQPSFPSSVPPLHPIDVYARLLGRLVGDSTNGFCQMQGRDFRLCHHVPSDAIHLRQRRMATLYLNAQTLSRILISVRGDNLVSLTAFCPQLSAAHAWQESTVAGSTLAIAIGRAVDELLTLPHVKGCAVGRR
jgi:hypothetical protein